jgi:hypothetical protein
MGAGSVTVPRTVSFPIPDGVRWQSPESWEGSARRANVLSADCPQCETRQRHLYHFFNHIFLYYLMFIIIFTHYRPQETGGGFLWMR